MTTIKPRAAQKYMEECASACPHCHEAEHMVRHVREGMISRRAGGTPRLVVDCYCAECTGQWIETYSLVAVQLIGGTS
jgi:hypothetical protein